MSELRWHYKSGKLQVESCSFLRSLASLFEGGGPRVSVVENQTSRKERSARSVLPKAVPIPTHFLLPIPTNHRDMYHSNIF